MVSVFCFSFPAVFFSVGKGCLAEIFVVSLESGCLSVCLRGRLQDEGCAEHPAQPGGTGGAQRRVLLAAVTSQVLSGLWCSLCSPRAVLALQEYLEDTLHVPHGAKSSLELHWAAVGLCATHPTQRWGCHHPAPLGGCGEGVEVMSTCPSPPHCSTVSPGDTSCRIGPLSQC